MLDLIFPKLCTVGGNVEVEKLPVAAKVVSESWVLWFDKIWIGFKECLNA